VGPDRIEDLVDARGHSGSWSPGEEPTLAHRPLPVGLLGRRHWLADREAGLSCRGEELSRAGPIADDEHSGDRLQGFDQDPAIRARVDQLEGPHEVLRGKGRIAGIEVEAGQVDVAQGDRRPGVRLLPRCDSQLAVATSGARTAQPAGDGGQSIGDGPLGWSVAELAEDQERLVAGPRTQTCIKRL
jgi:hypothetical protein